MPIFCTFLTDDRQRGAGVLVHTVLNYCQPWRQLFRMTISQRIIFFSKITTVTRIHIKQSN